MSGLIFLIFLAIWGVGVFFLVKLIVKPIANSNIKLGMNISLIALIFIAPVADEIVGGVQFRLLCNEQLKFVVNRTEFKDRVVVYQEVENKKYNNYMVPIVESYESYRALNSNELVIGWNVFRAEGGLLSRSLNLFESDKPYTFSGICISPKWKKSVFADFNITVNDQ